MVKKSTAKPRSRFLSRLLRDQRGNVIAIMAAAVIPVLGLVGGSVDMGRIYLVKTRLQAACDAGALMGRKIMGPGTWNTAANNRAREIFAMNFEPGAYGSIGPVYSFTETGGDVQGTATASVPVTLMRAVMLNSEARNYVDSLEVAQNRTIKPDERQAIYKQLDADKTGTSRDKVVTVNCNAVQQIPNTDVMFVLDVTGSMAGAASSSSTESRISGLKKATKCFFESLAKENIDDVTPAECGRSSDPTSGIGSDVSLRFGFVPYSVNANVGKLLPLNYMADSWTYQSREADWSDTTGYRAIYGAESGYSTYGSPNTSSGGGWGSWEDASSSVTIGGYTYDNRFRATSAECATFSPPPPQTGSTTGNYEFESQNPDPLTYPDPSLQRIYSRLTTTGETDYRYVHSSNRCRLQFRTRSTGSTTNYFQTTTPITWVPNRTFEGWDYKPVTFDISSLKNTASNAWNNSIVLPINTGGGNRTVTWTGCIEERQTKRVTVADPSGAWNPIPSDAYDMQIDLLPSSAETKWGPIFNDVVYRRYLSGNRTTAMVESDASSNMLGGASVSQSNASCPVAAKKYQAWAPTNFKNYVNSLSTGGNTYHDIGLLWGARLMSPQGIFAAENAMVDMVVDRHLIFMTDGDTNMQLDDYSAYGINWWDRRQNSGSDPTKTWLDSNLDARTQAICKAVRDKNIHVWVVAFGDDLTTATETNLQNCASSGKYFRAVSVADIITQFNSIASQISALRLSE
jgi:Putative Flp pilus-assembly TadE/G-like